MRRAVPTLYKNTKPRHGSTVWLLGVLCELEIERKQARCAARTPPFLSTTTIRTSSGTARVSSLRSTSDSEAGNMGTCSRGSCANTRRASNSMKVSLATSPTAGTYGAPQSMVRAGSRRLDGDGDVRIRCVRLVATLTDSSKYSIENGSVCAVRGMLGVEAV